MFSVNDLEIIATKFAQKVNQVTGIKIDKKDIAVIPKQKELLIKAWDCSLARVRYAMIQSEKKEDEVIDKAVRNDIELRNKIIKCKMYHLSQHIPAWANDIKTSLKEQSISPHFVDSLQFKIIDHGYKHKNYSLNNEGRYDYPFLAINIYNQQDFNFSFPINVYDAIDPIDIDYLKHNLFISILEKTIPTARHLKDL